MTTTTRGRCACGRVELELELPTSMFSHCHCRSCRSVHGAAFVSWTAVPPERLHIRGVEELVDYASSPGVRRSFCRHCGTHVRYLSDEMPDRAYVPAALLSGPLDRAPESHVNVSDAVAWHVISDDLPRYPGFD